MDNAKNCWTKFALFGARVAISSPHSVHTFMDYWLNIIHKGYKKYLYIKLLRERLEIFGIILNISN